MHRIMHLLMHHVTKYAMQVPPQSPQPGGTAPNSAAASPLDHLRRHASRILGHVGM